MIHAYTGTPGSGKSYALVRAGVADLARGRDVWANFSFFPELVYLALRKRYRLDHGEALAATGRVHELRSFEDLVGLYDCALLFDEAHDWLNARSWNIIPREIISWWSQHRHAGVEVHLATQRLGSVDTHVRSLCGAVWLCRPAPVVLQLPMRLVRGSRDRNVLRLTEIQDEAGLAGGRAAGAFEAVARNQLVVLDPVIARCYDTRGGVFPSPLHELERQRSELGAKLDFAFKRLRQRRRSGAADGLPWLEWREYVELASTPGRAAAVLRERWASGSSARVPSESSPRDAIAV